MLPMHSGCCQSELVLRPVHTARQPQGLSEKSAEVQKVQKPKLVSCFLYQNWILMWVCFLAFFNLTVWVSSPPGANSEAATALELKLKLWIKSTGNLSTPGKSASLQVAHAQTICYRSAGGKPYIVGHIIAWRLGRLCVGTGVTHTRKCGQG